VIHLYGVVSELDELPSVPGLDGAPLERRRIEGLELVVSRTERELPDVSEEAVLRHATVVEELMARSNAVLPAQFGRAFASEDELSGAVRTKAPELKGGLSRVRGCVEFGLRVLGGERTSKSAPPGSSGSDYMRTRLAETTARNRLAQLFHEPLTRLSRASARFGGAAEDLLQAAYLVPQENADTFLGHVRRLEASHPEVTAVCTGPWPPYSFAADREDDA
jgi:Gas vesicle synthesis protein GvpL/GvpF